MASLRIFAIFVFLIYINLRQNLVKGCQQEADIAVLLDASGSIGNYTFNRKVKSFVTEVVRHFVIGPNRTRFAAVTFASHPVVQFTLGQYDTQNKTIEAIQNIYYTAGSTDTDEGLGAIRTRIFNDEPKDPNRKRFLLVVTDGKSTNPHQATKEEASKLKNIIDDVFVVAIGMQDHQRELQTIATDHNHIFNINSYDHIFDKLQAVTYYLCPLSTTTTQAPPFNSTDVTVTVAVNVSKAVRQLCYECQEMPEAYDCENVIECLEGEECYTDFYISAQGHVFYDQGCQPKRVCDALNNFGRKRDMDKRQSDKLHLCEQCCDTDYCNRYTCQSKTNFPNRTLCYSCEDAASVKECDKQELCNEHHKCYATKLINEYYQTRWKFGCESPDKCKMVSTSGIYGQPSSLGKRKRQFDLFPLTQCYYCCDHDNCNHKECILGQTTMPPATTTRKPSTHLPKTTHAQTTTHKPITHAQTHPPKTTHVPTTTHKPHTHAQTHPSKTTHVPTSTHKPHTHAHTNPPKTTHAQTTTHKPHTHAHTHPPTTTTHKPHTHAHTHAPTTTRAPTNKPHTHVQTHPPQTTHKPHTQAPTTTHAPTTKPPPLKCNNCKYINVESQCNHTLECNAGEVCYISRIDGDVFGNQCFFSLGCMPEQTCKLQHSQVSHNHVYTNVFGDSIDYIDCCDSPLCNEHKVDPHGAKCSYISP